MRILFAFLGLLLQATAYGQEWPAKPVRMIVPFPAGGSADLLPRIVGERLAQQWGQPVIVENRAGAAGNIGATAVFQSEPDGYTLLASPPAPLVTNRLLYPKLAFDPTQFVPMTVIAAIPNVLLVHPRLAASSVSELIAYAKQNPGRLNYASQGNGTTSHLTTELLIAMAGGLRMTHVPYKGSAPALADLVAGQADLMFDNLGVSLTHVKSGKLKALGVASSQRLRSLPDLPTMAETLPGFESVAWFAIVGPPRTPAAIADRVAAGIAESLRNPDVLRRLGEMSAEPLGLGPAESAAFMKQETERWSAVIRAAGVKLD